jgi:hypothetical protein
MKNQRPDQMLDDLAQDPEILHWFQSLGPPPAGPAPPHLYARVQARLTQQQARWWRRLWLPYSLPLRPPLWTATLAAALLLSLSLSIWWGVKVFTPLPSGSLPASVPLGEHRRAAGPLAAYRFQAAIQPANAPGLFLASYSPVREPVMVVGFTPQATRATFFQLGTLYAEALATLHSGAIDAAAQRLEVLARVFASIQAPRPLVQYLQEMQALLQSQRYQGDESATFLALFEPLYEDMYAAPATVDRIHLFQTGVWLENVYLAAVANDPVALRHSGVAVEKMHGPLSALNVPPRTLEDLARLHRLVTQSTLTTGDITSIRRLVQDIQELRTDTLSRKLLEKQ